MTEQPQNRVLFTLGGRAFTRAEAVPFVVRAVIVGITALAMSLQLSENDRLNLIVVLLGAFAFAAAEVYFSRQQVG